MAIIKEDEMAILKSVAIKLSDGLCFIYTLQYHTEKGDRSKSQYRWLGRVFKTADLQNDIANWKKLENRLNPWMWPNDPSWKGKIITKDNNLLAAADFFRMKLKKLVDWDTGMKLMDGWSKKDNEFYDVKKYDTEELISENGTKISLKDKDTLMKLANQNVWKPLVKKSSKVPSVKVDSLPVSKPQPSENAAKAPDVIQEVILDSGSALAAE